MHRIGAASAAIAAALAIGFPAPATASPGAVGVPQTSSGMSAEFPVGICIAVRNDARVDFDVDADDLMYTRSVPCTDPARDYRVVAQALHDVWCGPDTSRVFITRDNVALCTVQDGV